MTRVAGICAALLAAVLLALPIKAQAGFAGLRPAPILHQKVQGDSTIGAAPALHVDPDKAVIRPAGMRGRFFIARRARPRPALRPRIAPPRKPRLTRAARPPRRLPSRAAAAHNRILRAPAPLSVHARLPVPRPLRTHTRAENPGPLTILAASYGGPRRPLFRPRRRLPPVFRPPRKRPGYKRPGPRPSPPPPRTGSARRIPPSQALRTVLRINPGSMGLGVELLPGGHPVYAVKLKTGSRIQRILVDAISGRLLDR